MKSAEEVHYIRVWENITKFAVHVEQIDRMGGFVPIKHAVFNHNHLKAKLFCVDDRASHAAARALSTDDEGIDVVANEMAN